MLDKLSTLLVLRADLDDLADVVAGAEIEGANVHLNVVGGETLHLLGPGSAPHEGLTVRTDLLNNFADLRLETHVKHAIGFVEHEVGNAAEVRLLGL
ncbi:hypothetical protein BC936DRAFT_143756 [Jimgerdemannia flammicorona]|uniref:Uncharacterized protein n=2 Tax=Jimgerdemannia flammicorona TaxID=994334 RepID=A0A433DDF0_9FUNG|nr:hypothetical protein BC936DRAFT_143756 [Jimgerdemannia flammicorona]RUS29087.1 hypothetical protein BC938DRAFT_481078 [Jimgerdemannia flammicorona]